MSWKRSKLHLLKEQEVQGRTREIFEEIKQALGVPFVNTMFQALASFPEFFELLWRTAKPALYTQEFFVFSERLGAEAYTRMHNYFSIPALRGKAASMNFAPEVQADLQEAAELYHYNYSVLLLLSAALAYAFEHPEARARDGTPVAIDSRYLKKPIVVEEEVAPPPTRRIYDDIKRTLRVPFLNTCYLNFGRWPDFLSAFWESLKPLLRTPLYEHNRLALRDSALSLASWLPKPLHLASSQMEDSGVPASDIEAIVELSQSFLNLISKQTLNIAFAKVTLEDRMRLDLAAA
jgi:hypothetical protein